jgi:hypothetical protein
LFLPVRVFCATETMANRIKAISNNCLVTIRLVM